MTGGSVTGGSVSGATVAGGSVAGVSVLGALVSGAFVVTVVVSGGAVVVCLDVVVVVSAVCSDVVDVVSLGVVCDVVVIFAVVATAGLVPADDVVCPSPLQPPRTAHSVIIPPARIAVSL